MSGGLTKADRELIVVATSIHNQCLYCVVSHSALHRIYSKKPTLADQVHSYLFISLLICSLVCTVNCYASIILHIGAVSCLSSS